MIETSFAKSADDIREFSQIALDNHLHNQRHYGVMIEWFQCPEDIDTLVLIKINNAYIGAAIILKENTRCFGLRINTGVFIHLEYRRKGYGKTIYNILKEQATTEVVNDKSIFYRSLEQNVSVC